MNEGVKVLIERMKTNPEDFEYTQDKDYKYGMKQGRFYWVSEQIQSYLTNQNSHHYLTLLKQEDIDALVNAFKERHEQEFTDKVMRDLFKEEEEPIIKSGWLPQGGRVSTALGQQNAMWSDPRIALLGQQQAHNQHLQAHIDARQQAMSQQQQAMVGITSAHTGTGNNRSLLGGLTGLFK